MELENFKHNLRNLKKCDQVWDEMNPVSGGRHCNKCDKKITDFSAMTHAEIALFMTEQDAPVCGYYLPDQLPNYNWKSNSISFSIGFSALFAAINVFNAAATVKQDLPICQTDKSFDRILIINENLSIGKPTDTIFIRGTVQSFDSTTKKSEAVPFAAVVIKGTKIGVSCNDKGEFILNYIPVSDNKTLTLVISAIALESRKIDINFTGKNEIDLGRVTLNKSAFIEYYIVVRKRSKLKRFWRQITKPFRS